MLNRTIHLRSGKWRFYAEPSRSGDTYLELISPTRPENRMSIRVGAALPVLDADRIAELARRPLLRLWSDELGVLWRIAAVGPGTPYQLPLAAPHLLFDSEQAYAGIVEVDDDVRLGELTDDELRAYRNRVQDLGGRRREFRPPAHVLEQSRAARGGEPAEATLAPKLVQELGPEPGKQSDPALGAEPGPEPGGAA
jgi:hypothetical protein